MACLKWMAPEGRPKVFPIYKRVFSIGRAGGNDVAVAATGLAECHAQIVFDGKEFGFSEVDTKADIELNGKKKRRSKLEHNDRLRLGGAEFVFSLFDEPDAEQENTDDAGGAQVKGLAQLHEFSERLMRASDLSQLLDSLIDESIQLTHADKGFLILLEGETAKITVARNLRQEDLTDGITHLSDSILSRVIASKRPLIVSDALHDTMFRTSESVMNLRVSSVMCAPLLSQGNVIGLIYLGNDSIKNLFHESSLSLFAILASQASLILQNALLLNELRSDRDDLADKLEKQNLGDIIGTSPNVVDIFRKVEKVAPADVSVLITGETGTGKELIARELHRRSPRSKHPFVVVNCGAIPETLMESELFGHVRGAFTGAIATRLGKFQAADKGTLFLDEIGEMPPSLQVKLLRALQERMVTKVGDTKAEKIDIRVLAATHRNLLEEIKKGGFREDLYYRLNVVNLHLAPLRERGDDVVLIAKHLLEKYVTEFKSQVKGFTPNALIALKKYEWPGNVRQLENRIKKALVLCDRSLLGPEDLDLFPEALQEIMPLAQAREEFQRRYILEILDRNNGNRTKTARDLGVDPRTIFRYLEREPGDPEI